MRNTFRLRMRVLFISMVVIFGLCSINGFAQEGFKNINGVKLYYKIIGTGTPIVVLHGGPALDHSYLLPQMANLANDYQLIFFDQRASGKSTGESDTASLTINNFVEDIEGIRKAFNIDKMNLMGHSWGGLLAMEYAVKYPDHLRSLILLNPSPASALYRDQLFRNMAAVRPPQDTTELETIEKSEGFKNKSPETMTKYFRLLLKSMFYNAAYSDSLTLTFDTSYARKSNALFRYLSNDLKEYDISGDLEKITCPKLFIEGDQDPIPAEAIYQIRSNLHNTKYVLLEHCGHFPYIEQPDKFLNAIKEFMNGLDK
ncbi:MAG: proline iminopeptidase-family hydrolase [Bacteroidota bacterium]